VAAVRRLRAVAGIADSSLPPSHRRTRKVLLVVVVVHRKMWPMDTQVAAPRVAAPPSLATARVRLAHKRLEVAPAPAVVVLLEPPSRGEPARQALAAAADTMVVVRVQTLAQALVAVDRGILVG